MKVPRIWQRQSASGKSQQGHPIEAVGWGWSESSVEEAKSKAQETASRIVAWLTSEGMPELNHYGYDERLPREEIVDEYQDAAGETHAFVSRNAYGCLILNTRDLMFIDVDVPKERPSVNPLTLIASLFGRNNDASSDPTANALIEIRATASRHPDWGFRIYRTFNGFRIAVTNDKIQPDSDLSKQLLTEFKSDPLYVRMCNNQQCFRARLTPKPWRCNVRKPPVRYPFETSGDENSYRQWEQEYLAVVGSFSTCELVETIGPTSVHDELSALISIHDQLTRASADEPLA